MIQAALTANLATLGVVFLTFGFTAIRITEYRIAIVFDMCAVVCVVLSLCVLGVL